MLLIESGIVVLILLLAFLLPKAGSSLFAVLERGLGELARHRKLSVFVVGLTSLVIRLSVLPIFPIPYPGVNDEFSYQLMADTFAHGRLTNPTHPMWIHFENISVIHQPTYCSVYYPAQGLFLALGQLAGKHPFWGVWLSIGLMSGAICWMLQAWVAPFWALLGGFLVAIRIGTFSYWANSYFGGSVAAIGGALVLGALPRLLKRREPGQSVIMGLGFAILGMSRPFETVFFSVPVVVVLALKLWSHRIQFSRLTLRRAILPCLGVVALAVCFMLYYFWRTTGHPLLPPYLVNLRRYTVEPSFPWLPLHTIPHYNHEFIKQYFLGYNLTMYHMARLHPAAMAIIKLLMLWFFFLGPLLTLPFLALGFVLGYGMKLRDIRREYDFC